MTKSSLYLHGIIPLKEAKLIADAGINIESYWIAEDLCRVAGPAWVNEMLIHWYKSDVSDNFTAAEFIIKAGPG